MESGASKESREAYKKEMSDFYDELVKGYHLNSTGPKKEMEKEKKSSIEAPDSEKETPYDHKTIEVTKRPKSNKELTTWYKKLPWDERVVIAKDERRLVQLQNLDPEYTSGDVEDIVYCAFHEQCSAKMVQHTAISNPYSGKALVIFRSKEVAASAVKQLHDGCLMLPNGRPLVGHFVNVPTSSADQSNFVGHLVIEKLKNKSKYKREAVSTSHFSQPNTIEFDMAMEWLTLQARSEECWKRLYKGQEEEIQKLKDKLKSK